MQLNSNKPNSRIRADLIDAARFINNHLLHDWVVRVQYCDTVNSRYTRWRQWGETFYAIDTPMTVVGAVQECRVYFPGHAIQLHAERYNPTVQFKYHVFRVEKEFDEQSRYLRYKQSIQQLLAAEREIMQLDRTKPDS